MFQLFRNLFVHAEGGDGGAGAAPGAAAPGTEAAGVTTPDAGERNRRPNKAERRAALEQKLAAEQAQRAAPKEAAPVQQAEAQPAAESWEDVKKRYKDEYGKDVQAAIQGRFKNVDAIKERATRQDAIIGRLAQKYGLKAGEDGSIDLDAFEKAVDDDDELYEERAAERGWSTETEKYVSKLERDAEQLKALRVQQQQEREQQEKDFVQRQQFQKRMEETEEAKKTYPGLDFGKEMENRVFASLMANPFINVKQAYELVHQDELRAAMQQAASIQATRALSTSIQAGQSMPTEGGLGRSPAASPQRVSVQNMTRAERKELNKRALRGEYIQF